MEAGWISGCNVRGSDRVLDLHVHPTHPEDASVLTTSRTQGRLLRQSGPGEQEPGPGEQEPGCGSRADVPPSHQA